MELAQQPIHSLICFNTNTCPIDLYLALPAVDYMLDLQTREVNRSVISSKDFTICPLWKFRAEPFPPMHFEFQALSPFMPSEFKSKKPPSPSEFHDAAAHGKVWIVFRNHSILLYTATNLVATISPGNFTLLKARANAPSCEMKQHTTNQFTSIWLT